MANNRLGLERMMNLCEKLRRKEIDFVSFIEQFEIICFNDISSDAMNNFKDGWSRGEVTNLMKHVLRAYDNDAKALRRLEVDLFLEDYDLSNDLEVIHY